MTNKFKKSCLAVSQTSVISQTPTSLAGAGNGWKRADLCNELIEHINVITRDVSKLDCPRKFDKFYQVYSSFFRSRFSPFCIRLEWSGDQSIDELRVNSKLKTSAQNSLWKNYLKYLKNSLFWSRLKTRSSFYLLYFPYVILLI